tara:strand:- start:212 stop:961 length:750 start_codon:yes stop_codon:yes gene_type:complete
MPDGLKKFALSERDSSLVLIDGKSGWHKNTQTLEYDREILCAECDQKIGKFEDAFQIFIRDFLDHPDRNKNENQRISVSCDSNRIVLAVLSILLKYSFSKRYPDIQLGSKYEHIISNAVRINTLPSEYGRQIQIVALGSNSHIVSKDGEERDLSKVGRAQMMGGRSRSYHTYFMEPPGTWFVIKVGNTNWDPIASNGAVLKDSKFITVNTAPFDKTILYKDIMSGTFKRNQWIEQRSRNRRERHNSSKK